LAGAPVHRSTLALLGSQTLEQKTRPAVSELEAALAREAALQRQLGEQAQRLMLAEEFEHRLLNGLQVICSLLSLQSRKAGTS